MIVRLDGNFNEKVVENNKFLQYARELPVWGFYKKEPPRNYDKKTRVEQKFLLDKKETKVPISSNLQTYGKSNDESLWSSFDDALNHLINGKSRMHEPIGFAICLLPKVKKIAMIDVDNCCKDGEWNDFAKYVISLFKDKTYLEITQSGNGLRVFAEYTELPPFKNENPKYGLEFYIDGRFSCITFNAINDTPVSNCQEELTEFIETYLKPDRQPIQPVEYDIVVDNEVLHKAIASLQKIRPCSPKEVSGKSAERYCYAVATCLINGFCLSVDQALPIFINEFGNRSIDENGNPWIWEEDVLKRKLTCALAKGDYRGRGFALAQYANFQNLIDQTDSVVGDMPDSKTEFQEFAEAGLNKQREKESVTGRKLVFVNDIPDNFSSSYLVDKHFERGSLNVVSGETGCFKSFFVLDQICSCSLGVETTTGFKTEKCSVVYICAEGQRGIKKRLRAWEKERGLKLDNNFGIITSSFNIASPEEVLALIKIIKRDFKQNPGIVVIDTLARNLVGDENKAEVISNFIIGIESIKDAFCESAVIAVHHSGWDKSRERGSIALRSAVDSLIHLIKSDHGFTIVNCYKNKDDEPFSPYNIVGKQVEIVDSLGNVSSSLVVNRSSSLESEFACLSVDTKRYAINYYKCVEGEEFTTKEFAEYIISQQPEGEKEKLSKQAKNIIDKLKEKKYIENTGDKRTSIRFTDKFQGLLNELES